MTTPTTASQAQLACIDTLTEGMTFEQLTDAFSVIDGDERGSYTTIEATNLIDRLMDLKRVAA